MNFTENTVEKKAATARREYQIGQVVGEYPGMAHTLAYEDGVVIYERYHGPTLKEMATEESEERLIALLNEVIRNYWRVFRETGFVHLDLHSENVVVTEDGPVVIDYGTSRLGGKREEFAADVKRLIVHVVDQRRWKSLPREKLTQMSKQTFPRR